MTPAEVAYRAVRAIQARAERSGIARERDVPAAQLATQPNRWVHANPNVDASIYLEAADRIAHGWIDIFADEHFQNHRSLWVVACLLGGEPAFVDERLDEGVVTRYLT